MPACKRPARTFEPISLGAPVSSTTVAETADATTGGCGGSADGGGSDVVEKTAISELYERCSRARKSLSLSYVAHPGSNSNSPAAYDIGTALAATC
mgnify:FL=1